MKNASLWVSKRRKCPKHQWSVSQRKDAPISVVSWMKICVHIGGVRGKTLGTLKRAKGVRDSENSWESVADWELIMGLYKRRGL